MSLAQLYFLMFSSTKMLKFTIDFQAQGYEADVVGFHVVNALKLISIFDELMNWGKGVVTLGSIDSNVGLNDFKSFFSDVSVMVI